MRTLQQLKEAASGARAAEAAAGGAAASAEAATDSEAAAGRPTPCLQSDDEGEDALLLKLQTWFDTDSIDAYMQVCAITNVNAY